MASQLLRFLPFDAAPDARAKVFQRSTCPRGCRYLRASLDAQNLQRGLMAVAALMPGRIGAGDDGGAAALGGAQHRPAAARALRCIAAVHAELQVCDIPTWLRNRPQPLC